MEKFYKNILILFIVFSILRLLNDCSNENESREQFKFINVTEYDDREKNIPKTNKGFNRLGINNFRNRFKLFVTNFRIREYMPKKFY